MKHASLATHYRPQTFAEVAGQSMVTAVLSRAAAEDRVAAAYLLSGTRGVGKTTIARILAKTLNCVHAPTAEPCNECANCQMITRGNHVDVTEIDGASNNSVDDARALRETIGYAAMEGRYKVFIIDEAHMLSKSAFNALLKTLEEPPPRVVFIFATTEVHKFPITIVSRCQHFVFKSLSEDALIAHLTNILQKEKIEFEPLAVRTIARRASGSVRDGMSLLGQTLALGGETLTMDNTRAVLGLAGQELFENLANAISKQDCQTVINIVQKLSEQGIDIGFFLRELINLWRTLFLLREVGKSIIPSLELSEDEARTWLKMAEYFSPTHIHAAWHMTLDSQRKIIQSLEPAAALELLLLNLTLMPRLLPLQNLDPNMPQITQSARQENNTPNQDNTAPMKRAEAKSVPKPQEQIVNLPQNEIASTNITHDAMLSEKISNTKTNDKKIAKDWQEVKAYLIEHSKKIIPSQFLQQLQGEFIDDILQLSTSSSSVYQKVVAVCANLEKIVQEICPFITSVSLLKPTKVYKPEISLIEEFSAKEELRHCLDMLDASVSKVRPVN